MIKHIGGIVLTPSHCNRPSTMKWLEVFPRTAKEIAWYAKLDHTKTTYGETESRVEQSPLLVELSYARSLGLK